MVQFITLHNLCSENDSLMIVAFVVAAVPPKPSANAGAGAALTMTDNQLGIDMWIIKPYVACVSTVLLCVEYESISYCRSV